MFKQKIQFVVFFLILLGIFLVPGFVLAQVGDDGVLGEDPVTAGGGTSFVLSGGGNSKSGGVSMQPDEFTGTATQQIEFPVPPGRNGLTPRIMLDYNSHRKNPNSWVGKGWELDLGSIQRLPERGVVNYETGKRFEVRLGGQSEELILKEAGVSSSTYGLDVGSGVVVDEYQGRVEGSFTIYLHLQKREGDEVTEDQGWVVIDKSGRRYILGESSFARLGDGDSVGKWFLEKVADTNGNEFTVTYGTNRVPTSISYTDITIEFIADSNRDYFPAYRQGFLQRENVVLLTAIEVLQGTSRLQKFVFEYVFAENRAPLLFRITQKGRSDSVELPSTAFYYYNFDEARWDMEPLSRLSLRTDGSQRRDGFLKKEVTLADMNGDGLVDQVVGFEEGDGGYFMVYFNNGNEFEEISGRSRWEDPFECRDGQECRGRLSAFRKGVGTDILYSQWLFLMDINGDALPDRVGRKTRSGDVYFRVALNNGRGWESEELWRDPHRGEYAGYSNSRAGFLDMNGDGLVDRLVQHLEPDGDDYSDDDATGIDVYLNTGRGFETEPTTWKDPLLTLDSSRSEIGKIYGLNDSNHTFLAIRDFNGDSLPDRIIKTTVTRSDDSEVTGFAVFMNLNGKGWAQPVVNNEGNFEYDSISRIFAEDPISEESFRGLLTRRHELIDFNQDGFLDRITGNKSEGKFYIYLYNGLGEGESYGHFSTSPLVFDDPVRNRGGEWDGQGYIYKDDEEGEKADRHTFMMDMNGDGYPDRVEVSPRSGDNDTKSYKIYPLRVNDITFSGGPDWLTDRRVNQPVGALKSISDGAGGKTAIEYIPSTLPLEEGVPNHRFLPFNIYVVHKVFSRDFTLPALEGYPEVDRNPNMRWETYNYRGGNFHVRYARESGDSITWPSTQFNGFQSVEKSVFHADGEEWNEYTTLTRYHQAAGDVQPLPDSLTARFDSPGYTHFALSGRPYYQRVSEEGENLVTETTQWLINRLETGNEFECDGVCFPKMDSKQKVVKESASSPDRISKITYNYDDYGNVTRETHLSDDDTVLMETETGYYLSDRFNSTLMIRDRPRIQTQKQGDTVYRQKEFDYDLRGNPKEEKFLTERGGSEYVTITRTFYDNGTLHTITDIDGITKTMEYDDNGLFPVTETVSPADGPALTTTRSFNRLTGEVEEETSPQGVGKKIEYDDFGQPTTELEVDRSGDEQLLRNRVYEFVYGLTLNGFPATLLRNSVWENRPGHPNTAPFEVTYADSSGQVLQKCSYTERGDYRLVQFRAVNGGQEEIQTEPVFSDNCDFRSTLASGVRTYRKEKDLQGRTTLMDAPDGEPNSPVGDSTLTYSTSAEGKLVKQTTFPESRVKKETFNYTERLEKLQNPASKNTTYEYNTAGDLRFVRGPAGEQLTEIQYDLLGRKKAMIDANMGTWTYGYDANGRLERQTDNKNQKVHYTYDGLGRVLRKEIRKTDESLERYEVYTYDDGDAAHGVMSGELYKVEEFDADENLLRRTRYGYESLTRRTTIITRTIPGVGNLRQTMTYDFRGNVIATIYPGGEILYFKYGKTGNLEKACSNPSCDGTSGEVYYSVDPNTGYNVFGALLREDFGNGVATEYDYYPNSHRLREKKTYKGETVYSRRVYTYDIHSNITRIDDPVSMQGSAAMSMGYDSLNRLTSYDPDGPAPANSLTYDDIGNILTNTASYSGNYLYNDPTHPHAVTDIGEEHFTYDNNGNMTADGSRAMTYNAQNQLTRVTMTNGVIVDFDYDYTGARASKKVRREDPLHRIHEATTHYLGDAMEIKGGRFMLHIHAGSQRIATKALGTIEEIMGPGGAGLADAGIYPEMRFSMAAPYLMFLFTLFIIASLRPVRFRLPAWAIRGPPVPVLSLRGLRANMSEPRRTWQSSWSIWIAFRQRRTRHVFWRALAPALSQRLLVEGLAMTKRVLTLWASYTQSLNEALKRFHYRPAFKFASLVLVFLFVVQFPMLAMADPTTPPADILSDPNFFYYTHGDHLGSSHVLTEGKEGSRHSGVVYQRGQLLQRFEYAPFGQETYVLNPNLKFDPSYTGQTYDIETGLYYYKARYYNPKLARFIQPDTVVPDAKNLQTYNKYSYVINNPLQYTDPSGHGFWDWFKKLFGAFIGVLVAVLTAGILGPVIAAAYGPAVAVTAAAQAGAIAAGIVGGVLGGVIGGAISGGLNGALMGGVMGLFGGAFYGGVGSLARVAGIGQAVLIGVGAGLSYATGGWKGLVTFGVGLAGAFAGKLVGAAIAGGRGTILQKSTGATNSQQNSGTSQPGDELVNDPDVRTGMEKAFAESGDNASSLGDVHEQGGWITSKGDIQRWPAGDSGSMAIPSQTPAGAVGQFHTHPYGSSERFIHGPSSADIDIASRINMPMFIIDQTSIMRVDFSTRGYHDVILR